MKETKIARRRVLSVFAVVALALGSGSFAKAENPTGVTLRGVPGDVAVSSPAPLLVRDEIGTESVRWIVTSENRISIPKSLEDCVKAVSGGVAIEFPANAKSSVIWKGGELAVKWVSGSATAASADNTFLSTSSPSYPLGPGDKLQVIVYNVEDMNQVVTVDPNSIITFPVLDKVPVEGLTVTDLQRKLEELLSQYVRSPQVSIQLMEYGSRFVNVMGQVRAPGRIPLKGAFKVLDAVSQAGGFQDNSGDVEIQRRDSSGQIQTRVFSKEELLTGNSEKINIFVQDQDVINVQVVKSVYVNGEVKSPGPFPYNKEMTLLRAITRAGGFTQWANKGRVDILREESGGNKVIHVDAGDIERGKARDVQLQPNDQIVVRERKFF